MSPRLITLLLGALLALVLLNGSMFQLDQGQQALVFQFGQIQGQYTRPGLYLKAPIVQSVETFDGRLRLYDNPNTDTFLTGEKKNVEVDYFILWRIVDLPRFYTTTRGQDGAAEDRLLSIVDRALRDQIGARTIQQVVSTQRDAMMAALEKSIAAKTRELGIEVADVRVKTITLPAAVSDSVYQRMRAERARVAADLRAKGAEEAEKIRANADRQVQVTLADAYRDAEKLRGDGDAGAARLYAEAYGKDPAFYDFTRSLQAYRDSFGGQHDVIVTGTDGRFFRQFKGGGGGGAGGGGAEPAP